MTQEAVDMNTIMDYLTWRGDLTFHQSALNEVDAAIFARFAYESFDGIVSESIREWKTIGEACNELLNLPVINCEEMDTMYDIAFVRLLKDTARFSNVKMSGYVNEIDEQKQIQFSACLFDLDGEQNYFVAFRGTDNTLVGWKEDFNMGFEFPVPAQQKALDYLERAVSSYKDGTFTVAGHSKGGNLAVYSATFCDDKFNKPIKDIYNFDGPGFTEAIIQTEQFKRIEHNIHTFVPEFSVVGMILEHLEDYTVVPSNNNGFMEHELLSWEIGPLGFVHKEEVSAGSRFVDKTLKDWLSGLTKDQREQFVETVYNLVKADDARTFVEFNRNKKETLTAMLRTYRGLDENTKTGFKETAKKLLDSARNVFKDSQNAAQ